MPSHERELKFLLDSEQALRFIAESALYLTPEIHDEQAPIAYTRTTYLDTSDHALYLAARTVNRRLRIREYASAPSLDVRPALTGVRFCELKESANGSRIKTRVRLPSSMPVDIVLEHLGMGAQPVGPQLTTWYRRTSYRGAGLRVTLDHGVSFCKPVLLDDPQAAEPTDVIKRWTETVLEVKLAGDLPRWLQSALDGAIHQLGLSKFESGMLALRASDRRAA